ncbi:MAG: AmmeMemoRadiSam system protein A [Clostridiales bacterium]|jgi:AmmeMemoRadiSam system protein A|nr:AmmeMemoRadiSam system protein A [Clostridiales bacterium]
MAILHAFALPHPPIAIPEIGRGEEKKIQNTLSAYDDVAKEIAVLKPDTIIFITPHNIIYSDYFHISPGTSAKGSFSKFGAPEIQFDVKYDNILADEIIDLAEKSGLSAGPLGEKDAELDHGVMVPMYFINRRYKDYQIVRISQSGMDPESHYKLGQCIAEASKKSKRDTVLIASGDLSHKLTESGPYGFAREGAEFDKIVTDAFSSADFLTLFNITDDLRESAAECGYNSLMVLAGCLDRHDVKSKLLSYEGPFGVGYAIASFLKGRQDDGRRFLDQHTELVLEDARESQNSEDYYCQLARRSLEFTVENDKDLPLPKNLPEELTGKKAGVFVSIHKEGHLRGCVGTIASTTENIALEIIQNAVSAGLYDNRFEPVEASELPFLTYKVDVLSQPETVSGPEELDVKKYGVIVTSGYKRGLLLPDLEGIDTVEEQISIARKKGDIPDSADITLERFEVVRHG